jgi:signal transduction histidine kinase
MPYRKPWQNLRFQVVAWYGLLAGLSMLVSDGVIYFEYRQALFGKVDHALEVSAIQALKNLDDEVDRLEFDPRRNTPVLASLLNEAGVEIYLLGKNGALKESFGDSLQPPSVGSLARGFSTVNSANGRWRVYTKDIRDSDGRASGWLIVARSLRQVDATLGYLFRRHLLGVPVLIGMVGLGGLFLANRALKPITQITTMMKRVRNSGDLTQRIHYQSTTDDELARLATLFDEMLDSLERTFAQQKRFMADASHELRTPLTTLKGLLQVTLRQPRDPDTYRETLQTIELEVDRLARLSNDLLLLSRLEEHHQDLPLEPVDLSDLLAAISAQIQPLAELQQLSLSTDIAPELRLLGSPDHLIRLFLNLLDNAVKHTPPHGALALRAVADNGQIQVSVADTGVGIPADHLPHLFERFYRVEKSRSRDRGGTGLGLAIAQEIVHRHHGVIGVRSAPGQGTTVTVCFPRQGSRPRLPLPAGVAP